MSIQGKIGEIRKNFLKDLQGISLSSEIEPLRIRYLGKKGFVQELMGFLKHCTQEQRPEVGKLINELKQEITSQLEVIQKKLTTSERESQFEKEAIDVTLPGKRSYLGRAHPVQKLLQEALDLLIHMGFEVQLGPDLETDYYNFEALNFEPDHPAREMHDTYYINSELLLRTHTSNVQVRVMEKSRPPIRVVAPGRCFRNETVSSRSYVFFHQVEAFYIDKSVSFSDLMATLQEFWSRFFQKEVTIRSRPSYFPFVEPGMEVDIHCTGCLGKGCRLCKHTGWLEVAGAGMIHPEVLKAGGIDPEVYTGYAWGMGIERLALLKYQIPDIRAFTENDLRFLRQFV